MINSQKKKNGFLIFKNHNDSMEENIKFLMDHYSNQIDANNLLNQFIVGIKNIGLMKNDCSITDQEKNPQNVDTNFRNPKPGGGRHTFHENLKFMVYEK